MNYLKKSGKWMVAACLLAGSPLIPVNAYASDIQTLTMSVQTESTTLRALFDQIEAKFHYTFLIRNNDINLDEQVTLNMENRSVEDVLKTALKNQHADFIVNDNRIIVYKINSKQNEFAEKPITQQSVKITGQIVDSKTGEPIIGANVLVTGTTNGTVTDADGMYELEVPANATLSVSYIGYTSVNIPVGKQTKINVSLKEDTELIDEVVVVGYIQQKKSNITSSVKNLSNDKLTDVTTPSIPNMLQGKVAGVQVFTEGGKPGESPKVRIRGKASIGSSVEPLWVVDGVIQSSAPNLNPNDVESMSVLKDAAATSLYGSRATNGVVVVATKQGKTGSRDLNVNARIGIGQINNGRFKLKNSSQIASDWELMGKEVPAEARTVDYDWWKNGTQLSLVQDYNASFSGGNEKLRAYVSGGYYNEEGTIKGYDMSRFRVMSNIDYQVTNWLKIRPKITAAYSKDRNDSQPDMYTLYTLLPFDNPYYEDGTIVNPKELKNGRNWYGRDQSNYMYDAQWNYTEKKILNVQGSFDFDIRFTDWLSFSSTNSYQQVTWKEFSYTDPRSYSGQGVQGKMSDERETWVSRFTNQMLRFNKSFGKDWHVTALAAYEFNDYERDNDKATKEGFFPGSEILNNATNMREITGIKEGWALNSFLMNANVAYTDRYFLQLSFRNDGSSRFGKDYQRGSFFSVSGGWNIMNEKFMDKSPVKSWLNDLKLRASYGGVGNLPDANYPQYNTYDITYSYAGGTAAYPYQSGNPMLTWEKSYETNIGLDARLWNRVSLTADFYVKNTSGLAYLVTLPAVSGFVNRWENVGAIVNRGGEITVGVDIFQNTPFKWSVDVNWSLNRNKINELYNGKDIISGYKIRREGYDIDTWYLRKWAGVDPANGDPLWEKIDENGNVTTTNKYNDATLQIAGRSTPDFMGGLNSAMSYRGFTLNMNWSFVVGNDVYHYDRELFDADGAYPTFNQMQFVGNWSRWENPGDETTHPKLVDGGNKLSNKSSTRYLENGSYMRLKNITLGYQIPTKILSKIGCKGATVTLSGDNLITFTGFSGKDPEVGENGEGTHKYPNVKKFVLGLNVNF